MPRGVGPLGLGWEGGTTGPHLGSGPEVQRPGLLVTRGLPQGGPPSTFRPCDIYSSILQTGAAETVTPSPGPYGAPGGDSSHVLVAPRQAPPASLSRLRSAPKNILLSGTTQGHLPQPALDPEPIWQPTVLLTGLIFLSHGTEKGGLAAPRVSGWETMPRSVCRSLEGRRMQFHDWFQ